MPPSSSGSKARKPSLSMSKRKSPSRTIGSLEKKRQFHAGSFSHRDKASTRRSSSSYKTIEKFQYSGYTGYSNTNYGNVPDIVDTPANMTVLKKISNYSMDKLIGEVAQNVSNVSYLLLTSDSYVY